MPHQPRFVPKEKLLNERLNLLIVHLLITHLFIHDLLIASRGNRRRIRPPEWLANRSYARLPSLAWYFGKKLSECIHWTTTLLRSNRKAEGIPCSGAGSHASTGTSSSP
jgi:hypothetical protein